MRRGFPIELVYQVFSLLIAFILVHALYVSLIRPQAKVFLEHEAAQMQADPEWQKIIAGLDDMRTIVSSNLARSLSP